LSQLRDTIRECVFLGFLALACMRGEAKTTWPAHAKADQTMGAFFWALYSGKPAQVSEKLAKEFSLNGQSAGLKSLAPLAPCQLWTQDDATQNRVTREKLAEFVKQNSVWIKAQKFHGRVVFYGTRLAFVVNEQGTHVLRAICADPEPQRSARLYQEIASSPLHPPEKPTWVDTRRAWAYHNTILASLYARVWNDFFNADSSQAARDWAPLERLLEAWLSEVKASTRPESSVDRELQRWADAIFSKVARLRPDLAANEVQFYQRFTFEQTFLAAAEVFQFAHMASLWHFRSLDDKEGADDSKRFLSSREKQLLECCFSDKGLKTALPVSFSPASTPTHGIPLPPP
jgi:hypothetical protein